MREIFEKGVINNKAKREMELPNITMFSEIEKNINYEKDGLKAGTFHHSSEDVDRNMTIKFNYPVYDKNSELYKRIVLRKFFNDITYRAYNKESDHMLCAIYNANSNCSKIIEIPPVGKEITGIECLKKSFEYHGPIRDV